MDTPRIRSIASFVENFAGTLREKVHEVEPELSTLHGKVIPTHKIVGLGHEIEVIASLFRKAHH